MADKKNDSPKPQVSSLMILAGMDTKKWARKLKREKRYQTAFLRNKR